MHVGDRWQDHRRDVRGRQARRPARARRHVKARRSQRRGRDRVRRHRVARGHAQRCRRRRARQRLRVGARAVTDRPSCAIRRAATFTRCDGKPARLFPGVAGTANLGFDQLRPTQIAELDPNAPDRLTAAVDTRMPASSCRRCCSKLQERVRGVGRRQRRAACRCCTSFDDGDLATVWRHPDGRWSVLHVSARASANAVADEPASCPGDPHGNPEWSARPKRLVIVADKGSWSVGTCPHDLRRRHATRPTW